MKARERTCKVLARGSVSGVEVVDAKSTRNAYALGDQSQQIGRYHV